MNSPCREFFWIVTGLEFCSDQGTVMVVVRTQYGLKLSGADQHTMLPQSMDGMKFKRHNVDYDVWYRPAEKPNGFKYYEYELILFMIFCLCHIRL